MAKSFSSFSEEFQEKIKEAVGEVVEDTLWFFSEKEEHYYGKQRQDFLKYVESKNEIFINDIYHSAIVFKNDYFRWKNISLNSNIAIERLKAIIKNNDIDKQKKNPISEAISQIRANRIKPLYNTVYMSAYGFSGALDKYLGNKITELTYVITNDDNTVAESVNLPFSDLFEKITYEGKVSEGSMSSLLKKENLIRQTMKISREEKMLLDSLFSLGEKGTEASLTIHDKWKTSEWKNAGIKEDGKKHARQGLKITYDKEEYTITNRGAILENLRIRTLRNTNKKFNISQLKKGKEISGFLREDIELIKDHIKYSYAVKSGSFELAALSGCYDLANAIIKVIEKKGFENTKLDPKDEDKLKAAFKRAKRRIIKQAEGKIKKKK